MLCPRSTSLDHSIASPADVHSTPSQPLFHIQTWPVIMLLRVYLIHMTTRGSPVLSSIARRPLAHTRSPLQMAVPPAEITVILDQQEKTFVSKTISPHEPLAPLNKVCSTTPNISHDNYGQLDLNFSSLPYFQ